MTSRPPPDLAAPVPCPADRTARRVGTGAWGVVRNAPLLRLFSGEPVTLTLRVEDQGAAPAASMADLTLAIDGGAPMPFWVPVNEDIELPLTLPHGGNERAAIRHAGNRGEIDRPATMPRCCRSNVRARPAAGAAGVGANRIRERTQPGATC